MNITNLSIFKLCLYLTVLIMSPLTSLAYAQNSTQTHIKQSQEAIDKKKNNLPYQVQIKARKNYDFMLSADYRFFLNKASAKHMPGVLILHDCEGDRDSYEGLSTSVANLGIHTLSLDLRGYGSSVNEAYSQEKSKKMAKSIVDFQSEVASLMTYWHEDILAAYRYLRSQVDKSQGISIVSSGCSSAFAVGLAESVHVKSLVMLTPEMNYGDKERYKNLVDIPSYFISSAQHATSYATVQEIFAWNGDKHSKLLVYKGDKVNHNIIRSNVNLVNDIALWLKFTLR